MWFVTVLLFDLASVCLSMVCCPNCKSEKVAYIAHTWDCDQNTRPNKPKEERFICSLFQENSVHVCLVSCAWVNITMLGERNRGDSSSHGVQEAESRWDQWTQVRVSPLHSASYHLVRNCGRCIGTRVPGRRCLHMALILTQGSACRIYSFKCPTHLSSGFFLTS